MQNLSNKSGSDCSSSIFGSIEAFGGVVQSGWDDESAVEDTYRVTIETANKSINLVEYLQTKMVLEEVPSNSMWRYKSFCPWHKGGNERTASFFINTEQNRYYCQSCGVTGGVVEYISKVYQRPPFLVAKHILSCTKGNYAIDTENIKKAADKKRFQLNYLKISDLYRKFAKKYIDDDDALNYINKCFAGLDNVMEDNQEKIEISIEQIVQHLESYLKKYEEK